MLSTVIIVVRELDLLLELEHKYGFPKQFRPAIEDVLDYLQNVMKFCLRVVECQLYPPISLVDNTDSIFQDN